MADWVPVPKSAQTGFVGCWIILNSKHAAVTIDEEAVASANAHVLVRRILHKAHLLFQTFRKPDIIAVHRGDVSSQGVLQPQVQGLCYTQLALWLHDLDPWLLSRILTEQFP